jgi:Domain of unknown function (DUF1707)
VRIRVWGARARAKRLREIQARNAERAATAEQNYESLLADVRWTYNRDGAYGSEGLRMSTRGQTRYASWHCPRGEAPVTTGPGDEKAAAARGRLRASHADREQVIGTLKVAFVQGRLAKGELDVRVGQTFAARTYADLAALVADLPAGLAAAPPPRQSAAARARRPVKKVLTWGACWFITPAILVAGLLPDNHNAWAVALPLALVYFMAWMMAGVVVIDSWHQQRSRGQLPPRPAQAGQALEGEQDGGIGDGLILCEARSDVHAGHLPGHGVIQCTWRSVMTRREQRPHASLQVPA